MIVFLTSSLTIYGTDRLHSSNNLIHELKVCFPMNCSAIFICSDSEGHERNDFYAAHIKDAFENEGFEFRKYCVLDGRNEEKASKLIKGSNLIILGGGHTPTQNEFFQRIALKDGLEDFQGLVIGISAGSVNSAEIVYAMPEEEGETSNPMYKRFLKGLDLTKTILVPHYQALRDEYLDGLHLINDVGLPDSKGRTFYGINDGSYLLIKSGREEIRGEAYMIRNGEISKIAEDGTAFELP